MSSFYNKIHKLAAKVPHGKIATYGQLALMAGSPRASRIAGAAMCKVPDNMKIPCHRIIYGDGSLCKGDSFGGYAIQRQLLESEGIVFLENGNVDLKSCIWDGII